MPIQTVSQAFSNEGVGGFSFRNKIINGAMEIDQRNAGSAVTADGSLPVDRFKLGQNTDGACSVQQDSSAPAGFINSIKYTTTTADGTLTTTQNISISQNIEGTNIADLAWGTASAKTVTLSFWVRSSLTGTFAGALTNSAISRSYPFTYTISSANTWEYKTITVVGDTTGTWLTTTGIGMRVIFALGVGPDRSGTAGAWTGSTVFSVTGATSVIGTLNATWYITGVQLEVGSVATPFERRPYGTELALCQRYYYQTWGSGSFSNVGSGYVGHVLPSPNNASTYGASSFPVSMRAAPTVTLYDSLGASGKVSQPAVANGLAATAGSISIAGFFAATKDSTTFTTGTPVIAQFIASIEL